MIGEIGGSAEEQAADFIAAEVTKPVVGYIAGVTAPPARRWDTPGPSSAGPSGTAQAKQEALEAVGVTVVIDPDPDRRGGRRPPLRPGSPCRSDPPGGYRRVSMDELHAPELRSGRPPGR